METGVMAEARRKGGRGGGAGGREGSVGGRESDAYIVAARTERCVPLWKLCVDAGSRHPLARDRGRVQKVATRIGGAWLGSLDSAHAIDENDDRITALLTSPSY